MEKKHSGIWGMGGRGQSREMEQGIQKSKGRVSLRTHARSKGGEAAASLLQAQHLGAEAGVAPQVQGQSYIHRVPGQLQLQMTSKSAEVQGAGA